jgi:bifunctional UDP-N-acetylglucosamine pyrophosphorylase/glucosamine-1-phosphate N-acetyltransferase
MKALILAAGHGLRMGPLTSDKPKPLLPVAGKPILQHTLEQLQNAGIGEVWIIVGWKKERLMSYLRELDLKIKINYIYQEKQLGTAHAIGMAESEIDESFLSLNGDVLVEAGIIKDMVKSFSKHKGTMMAAAKVDDISRFGEVIFKDGKVQKIIEKGGYERPGWINAGIYAFKPDVFDYIRNTEQSPRGEYEITDTLELIMEEDKAGVMVQELEDWHEIGYPWDLLTLNEKFMPGLKGQVLGEVEQNAVLKGEVFVGDSTIIKSGSYIVGPVYIGKNCDIGPNCLIRPSTVLLDNTKVGAAVEVKNSIIMEDSKVPHHSYLGDTVVGERCNIGCGTKVANLRLDSKNVRASVRGREVNTGRRKLGAIIGNDVKTGINCSINVGTIIGEGCFIGPGAVISGNIEPGSRVY